MKLPMPSPNPDEQFLELAEEDPHRMMTIMSGTMDDSQYLHWDKLRHKTPPDDLSLEEWWLALKVRRRQQRRNVALRNMDGSPFSYVLTDRILQLSEEITSRSSGHVGVAERTLTTRSRNQYIVRSLVEEAITSSQLEGASTSRRLAQEMLDSGRSPRDESEVMIWNNYVAMQRIREIADQPLTPDLVLELHRILVDDTLDDPSEAGKLDTATEDRVAVWDNELKIHQPPPADELPQRLQELCDFANGAGDEDRYLSPVVRSVIVHFMIGFDHYFVDGNGRTARALFYWSMLHHGFWISEYVAISRILRNAPSRYSLAYIYTEDDEGDLTYFIHYQLDIFLRALNDLDEYIEGKRAEIGSIRDRLRSGETGLNHRQLAAMETLTEDEGSSWTVKSYAHRFTVSQQTARNDLNDLTEHEYVKQFKSGHQNLWRLSQNAMDRLGIE